MSEALRVSQRHFRDRYQPSITAAHTVGEQATLRFRLGAFRDILDAEVARAEARRNGPDDDPLFSGPNSPALERLRAAKAQQEEIKLAEMRGEYASIARVRERLDAGAAILRRCGEVMESQFGEAPANLLREHLAEWASCVEVDVNGRVVD